MPLTVWEGSILSFCDVLKTTVHVTDFLGVSFLDEGSYVTFLHPTLSLNEQLSYE